MSKACTKCKVVKEDCNFYKCSLVKSGLSPSCKACSSEYSKSYRAANRERVRNNISTWVKSNPEKCSERARRATLKRRYGMSVADYDLILKDQEGMCKICGESKRLYIDHCHDSGIVRGLLCASCNIGVGHLEKSGDFVQKALDYIKNSRVHNVQFPSHRKGR